MPFLILNLIITQGNIHVQLFLIHVLDLYLFSNSETETETETETKAGLRS